jgi:septal ring factor EnvC (AmiA/AmiB activator)
MNDNTTEINKDNFEKFRETHKQSLDRLFNKVGELVKSFRDMKDENNALKETVKDLTNKITELKIQLSKSNSDLVLKDKEISDLKNVLLDSNNNKLSMQDKQNLRSRISELISRIDVHLEQYDDEKKDYEF